MTKAEQDAFWTAQVSKLRRAGLLQQTLPPHQGYRQKLRHWRSGDITLNAGFDDRLEWVHVDITFTGEFRRSRYLRFQKQQTQLVEAVERDLDIVPNEGRIEWVWEERIDKGESWIILRHHKFNLSDKSSRDDAQDWVTSAVRAFLNHFGYLLDTM